MKEYEVSARTIEEAISQGLEHLGVSISDVTVDVLEEGSKGLFGLFGSRPAKVRLTMKEEEESEENVAKALLADALNDEEAKPKKQEPKAPKAEKPEKAEKKAAPKAETAEKQEAGDAQQAEKAEKPAPKPRKPREPKAPKEPKEPKEAAPVKEIVPAEQADRETAAGRAQEFLQELTKLMGVNVSVAVATDEEGNVRVNMEGDTLGILIGRRGETLDALQYLTSLQVNKGQNAYTRVTLDTEGYRAKREEALVRLANRMANRAQKTGRKVSLEPMNPYERRILHSALQDHPAVTTHSEGEEPNRHVVITLKSN
ncbi:MAG: RNA-binding cell elongation regulator Jag/EloR [Clostridia bacterium]|nr:RNA-binding cell elongation regulator Jag/EloR [Clostridia bacterium]